MSDEAVFDARETASSRAALPSRPTRACEGCGGAVEVARGDSGSSFNVPLPGHGGHAPCPLCGCGVAAPEPTNGCGL